MKTRTTNFSQAPDDALQTHDSKCAHAVKSNVVSSVKSDSNHKTGYKNPPHESRFQKGRSGNPHGRPPKLRQPIAEFRTIDIVDAISKELSKSHTSFVNGKSICKPTLSSLFQIQIQKANDGDQKSFRVIFDTFQKFIAVSEKERQQLKEAANTYRTEKLLEIKTLQMVGIDFSYIVPHPDHVFIDVEGHVRIIGPKTLVEKRKWDTLAERRESLQNRTRQIKAQLKRNPNTDVTASLLDENRHLAKRIEYISTIIPDYYSTKHVLAIYSNTYRNRDNSITTLNLRKLTREQRDLLALAVEEQTEEVSDEHYEISPEAIYNRSQSRK